MERTFHLSQQYHSSARMAELRGRIRGSVLLPEETGYEDARLAWELSVDQHPAVILLAESTEDIIEAVRFARSASLGIAVQATGHGVVRSADGSMLILTKRMDRVQVDLASNSAAIEAGVLWGSVLAKSQPVGLAPLLGSSPGVGAIGYTLGGGLGWLGRKYGLASDSVIDFEVVTADGQKRRASMTESPDLFWGLRGGGGSLGIVTQMRIKLYPVTTVYGGNLYYRVEDAKAVITRYREWINSAPAELTSAVVLMNFPPLPELPEALRGRSAVMVRGCYCGNLSRGETLINEWRSWRTPFLDDFKVMPFTKVGSISDEPIGPVANHRSSAWLKDLRDETIEAILHYLISGYGSSPLAAIEIRHAGGAIADPARDTAAYSHRQETMLLQMIGMVPTVETSHLVKEHMSAFKDAIRPSLSGRVFMNFLEGAESQERVRDGFSPKAFHRLSQLKAKYDPENRLRFSFQIPPLAVDA